MMDDKILERMLDNLIEEAGKLAIKEMESKEEEIPEVQFSKEHEEKVKKIFEDARREREAKSKLKAANEVVNVEKVETKKRKTKFNYKRLFILAAVIVTLSGILTTTNRMER